MNSDKIIPWGFQETAGNFSIKRDYFISVGGWVGGGDCQIWRHTLHHYSSTFLCHADFIPDRSCLDVPVGRKCSACNGLAPENSSKSYSLSLKHFPSYYLSTVARLRDLEATGRVGYRCSRIPIRYWLILRVCSWNIVEDITKRTYRGVEDVMENNPMLCQKKCMRW